MDDFFLVNGEEKATCNGDFDFSFILFYVEEINNFLNYFSLFLEGWDVS